MNIKFTKAHFWEWFQRNNHEYLQIHKKSKKEYTYWLNELDAHLRAYGRFVTFNLMTQDSGKAGQLILTARGKAKYFKKVDQLLASAPVMAHWKVTALAEPVPFADILEEQLASEGINPEELWFDPNFLEQKGDGTINLHIITPLYPEDGDKKLSREILHIIYDLIGERSFGLDLHHIEIYNLSDSANNEFVKIEELPGYLSSRKSSVFVDGLGEIRWEN